jgi:hypothetical protein
MAEIGKFDTRQIRDEIMIMVKSKGVDVIQEFGILAYYHPARVPFIVNTIFRFDGSYCNFCIFYDSIIQDFYLTWNIDRIELAFIAVTPNLDAIGYCSLR